MKESNLSNGPSNWDVCHVTSGHEVTDTRIFRRECTRLLEHGFVVSLMAQHRGQDMIQGIRIHPLPVLGVRWYRRWILLFPILFKILTQRHHVVHFHDPDLLPVMVAYSRLTRKPVVWDAHENYQSVIERGNKLGIPILSRMLGRAYNFVELQACRLADARVVTVSEPMAERYRKTGLDSIACANYVDNGQIPFPPLTKRADPPVIVMTGTMRGESFEIQVVEAFSILRKRIVSRLAFWGELLPAVKDALRKRAKDLGVEDAVEFAGPFPWKRLVTELIPQSSAAVYMADPKVLQSRNEIPNRVFEYWANGVPVIVSNGTLCGELVKRVNGGLTVNYGDTADLAGALESLLNDPDLMGKLGSNGRRAVLHDYNWLNESSKLVDLYDGLLREGFPKMHANRCIGSKTKRTDGEYLRGVEEHEQTR